MISKTGGTKKVMQKASDSGNKDSILNRIFKNHI